MLERWIGHDGNRFRGNHPWEMVFIKESDPRGLIGISAKEIDGLAPSGLRATVEFTEVKHLPLKHASS